MGYVFLDLDNETQIGIMARCLLRDAFYSKLLVKASEQEVALEDWMIDLKGSTVGRRISYVRKLCKIAEEATPEGTFKGFKMPEIISSKKSK